MNYRDWIPDQIGPRECFIIYAVVSMLLSMLGVGLFIMLIVSAIYVAAAMYIDKNQKKDEDETSEGEEVSTAVFSSYHMSWRSFTLALNVACVLAFYFTYKGSGSFFLGLLAFGCVYFFGYKHGNQHKVEA